MLACDDCAVSWSATLSERCWICAGPGHGVSVGQKWKEVKTGYVVTVRDITGPKISYLYDRGQKHAGSYTTVSEYFFKDFELCPAI